MKLYKCPICFKNSRCHCIQLIVVNIVIKQDKKREQVQSVQLNNIETLLKELLKQKEEKKITENRLKRAIRKIGISLFKFILFFIKWIIVLWD